MLEHTPVTTPLARTATAAAAPRLSSAAAVDRARQLRKALRARETPDLLMAALGASWLLVLVLFLIARSGLADVRAAAQTIGRDAEPSVVAARLRHGRLRTGFHRRRAVTSRRSSPWRRGALAPVRALRQQPPRAEHAGRPRQRRPAANVALSPRRQVVATFTAMW
jgi:hypothetical protein